MSDNRSIARPSDEKLTLIEHLARQSDVNVLDLRPALAAEKDTRLVYFWPTEFFPTKNGVQVASPSNLSGLILTSSTGSSTITFGSSTAYTYSHNGGGAFESPHTGTYRTVTCAQAIPSPGSLFLLLSALPVLVSIRRRQTARRRKTVHCAYLDMQVPDGAVPSPHA